MLEKVAIRIRNRWVLSVFNQFLKHPVLNNSLKKSNLERNTFTV